MGSGSSKSKKVPDQKPISRQPSMKQIDEVEDREVPVILVSEKGSPVPSQKLNISKSSRRSKNASPVSNDTTLANEKDQLSVTGVSDGSKLKGQSSVLSNKSQEIKPASPGLTQGEPPRTSTRISSKRSSSSRTSTTITNDPHRGRCPHCAHCQRHGHHYVSSSEPKPKWIIDNPGLEQPCIHMDNYDDETIKENLVQEYGHYPGGYDYQPFLTIEETPEIEDTDDKAKYYKQPKVATTQPRTTPTHTPFPGFKVLEQRELRVNKPYSDRLYAD